MATDTKDLETLRAESQQIGSRITRLSIILISVLTVVTFTIIDAPGKVDLHELKQKLEVTKTSFSGDGVTQTFKLPYIMRTKHGVVRNIRIDF